MPETIELDETPFAPEGADPTAAPDDDGKVECPECGGRYKPSGINRHITVSHGGGPNSGGTGTRGKQKRGVNIAEAGAQFQIGVSMVVSMACRQCATILYQDAQKDWDAIDKFCSDRPQLRKQMQTFLTYSDFMMLLGAIAPTAQKMVGHHSIGERLHFGIDPSYMSDEHSGHNPMDEMAAFMMGIPEDERNQIINQAFAAMAERNGNGAEG